MDESESVARLGDMSNHAEWMYSHNVAAAISRIPSPAGNCAPTKSSHRSQRTPFLARFHFVLRSQSLRARSNSQLKKSHRHLLAWSGREKQRSLGHVRPRDYASRCLRRAEAASGYPLNFESIFHTIDKRITKWQLIQALHSFFFLAR